MRRLRLTCLLIAALCLCAAVLSAADISVTRTFRRAQPSLNTLDPAFGSDTTANCAISLLYQPLLDYDYSERPYKLIPAAAAAMPDISPDGKVYTFHLRESYYTDDPCFGGKRRRVKASDFIFAWQRLADRTVGGSGEWIVANILGMNAFSEATSGMAAALSGLTGSAYDTRLKELRTSLYAKPIPGLTAPDDNTLRIELNKPNNQFLWLLAIAYTSPIAPEAEAYYSTRGTLSEHPVGAGAYKLKSWRRGYEIVFSRNPEWYGWKAVDFSAPKVPFETIRYPLIKDASTQWLMLLTGRLDFLEQIDRNNMEIAIDPKMGLAPDLVRRGIRLFTSPTLKVYYLGFNMDDPVLGKNKPLRQAVNAAFDTARWTAYYRGRVKPLNTVAPYHVKDALKLPFPYAYDLNKAREKLKEAGYPGGIDPKTGNRLELTVEVGNATQDTTESMELVASFLGAIGIKLNISVNTWQAHLEKIRKRQSQMFLMGWVGDYPDLETFMQLFVSRNQSPGPNRSNYVNAEADRLYDIAVSSRDPKIITICWTKMQQIVLEDCPWLFLHYALDFSLVSDRVINYAPHNFPYGMEKHYRMKRPDGE